MTAQLRQLALFRQGLRPQPQFGRGLSGTLNAIEHLGYVQIDTLAVVERAHHHVLWSRVPDYDPQHLNQLVSDRQIFEHWFHAASYLPIRDYRFALPKMASIRNGENRYYPDGDQKLKKEILARIRSDGPSRARDFEEAHKKKGDWWDRRPGLRALDRLFMQGDLMICERNGMEKVYDLAERCLPDNIDLSAPSINEYAEYLFDTTLRAHGVFTMKQLVHLKTGKAIREAMLEVLMQRVEAGEVRALDDSGLPSTYIDAKTVDLASHSDNTVKLLSPFDNVVIHRDRLSSLFDFDYRIECYVPAPKRQFGYFCLPILYGDKFVGRIDCKAHRAQKRLEVLSMHLEKEPHDRVQFFAALKDEIQSFAGFNNCETLDKNAADEIQAAVPAH